MGIFRGGGVITTNSSGAFSIPYTAPANAGSITLQATSGGGQVQTVLSVQGPTITFAPSTYSTGITTPVTIQGTAMVGSSAYTGSIVISGSGVGGSYPSSVVTNLSGNFSFVYTPLTNAGSEMFTASSAGSSATANVGVSSPTETISPTNQTVSPNTSHSYIVTVTAGGVGLSGQSVTISTNSGGNFTSTFGTTNSSGQVTFTLNVGSTSGNFSIIATVDGSTTQTNFTVASYIITVTASPNFVSPSGTSTVSGQLMLNGMGVSGTTVSLTTSFGSITSAVLTNSSGQFFATYTAPSSTGSGNITASALGTSASTSISAVIIISVPGATTCTEPGYSTCYEWSSPGTYTATIPTGTVFLEAAGAGGGGGGGLPYNGVGGNGGEGGLTSTTWSSSGSLAIVVGQGGNGGTVGGYGNGTTICRDGGIDAPAGNGANGGTTIVGIISAQGGGDGTAAPISPTLYFATGNGTNGATYGSGSTGGTGGAAYCGGNGGNFEHYTSSTDGANGWAIVAWN